MKGEHPVRSERVAVFMTAILGVVLCLIGLAVLAVELLPSFVFAATAILLTAFGYWKYRDRLAARWPSGAAFVGRLAAVIVLLVACRAALDLSGRPVVSLIFLAAGVFQCAALWTANPPPPRDERSAAPSTAARLAVVVAVFIVTVAAGYLALAAVSTQVAPDTASYWATPKDLLTRTPGVPIRTPQYSLLFAGVQLLGGHGRALLAAQITLRAIGVGLIVWLISARSLLAASIVGALLAIDPVGALSATEYLSESVYTSALMIATWLAVWQLGTRERRIPRLFAVGLLFGLCLLVRPTSEALIVLIVAAFAVSARSTIVAGSVAAGYAAVALSIALYHYVLNGFFTIVTVGLYVAFPLFVQHLLNPQNGPASRTVYRQLIQCDPTIDYSNVSMQTANSFVFTRLLPCTLALNGNDRNGAYRLYASAYREALLARPFTSGKRLLSESCRYLGVTVSQYGGEIVAGSRATDSAAVCALRPPFEYFPPALMAFVCPMPAAHPKVRDAIERWLLNMRSVYQPYLYVYSPHPGANYVVILPGMAPKLFGGAALLYMLLAFLVVRPRDRPMVVAASAVIIYNALATAFGQVTISRYVGPMAPFFLIVTGLVCAVIVEDLVAFVRGMKAGSERGRVQAELA